MLEPHEEIKFIIEHFTELAEEVAIELWQGLTEGEKDQIQDQLWENPEFILEAQNLQEERKKKNRKLSFKAKGLASKRKARKAKRVKKAARLFRKLRKYTKKKTPIREQEESFVDYLLREDQQTIDSRGPIKLLVKTTDDKESRAKLEDLSKKIYQELGIPTWIEEERPLETEYENEQPLKLGLFVSLHSYSEDEFKEIEKQIKSLQK